MALIKDRENNSNGSYERIFNNKKLGELISKTHATAIANGNELEKLIIAKANEIVVKEVEKFEKLLRREFDNKDDKNVFIIPKRIVKKSTVANKKEPDFLVLTKLNDCLNIIELKDGWVFDTKKAKAEYKQLQDFQNDISKIVSYKTQIFVCSFNSNDKEQIFSGFKKEIPKQIIMTGREFCDLINIDYNEIKAERDKIKKEREKDSTLNFNYFVDELLSIEEVKKAVLKKMN